MSKVVLRDHTEQEKRCAERSHQRQEDADCIGCLYRHDDDGCADAGPCGDQVFDYEEVAV